MTARISCSETIPKLVPRPNYRNLLAVGLSSIVRRARKEGRCWLRIRCGSSRACGRPRQREHADSHWRRACGQRLAAATRRLQPPAGAALPPAGHTRPQDAAALPHRETKSGRAKRARPHAKGAVVAVCCRCRGSSQTVTDCELSGKTISRAAARQARLV